MKKDEDGLPVVEPTAKGLGVRPGVDIDIDSHGNAVVNGKGMSVNPSWRVMPHSRIPKRLRAIVPGARGANDTFCYKAGEGAFQRCAFADGLVLEPDTAIHGCITPAASVSLERYQNDLAETRSSWQIDES